jgi:hypothetical protein
MTIGPHVHQQYAEEYLAGIDRDVGAGVSPRAQYIRRNFRQAVGFIDTGTVRTLATAIEPGPDGFDGTGDDNGPITLHYDSGTAGASCVKGVPLVSYTACDTWLRIRWLRG